jgi:aspartate kinase
MIVMKFGGSSLASAASIARVASIVRSQAHRHPVIVASALGDTTDALLEILSAARRGHAYSAWKQQEAVKTQHFAISEDLLHGREHSDTDYFLRETFRDLHIRMLELCEGERVFTPELQDWTLSLGEQLSSRLLAAVLQEHCGETTHFDARKLIVTDGAFTQAQPRYWETYARLRWSLPLAARDKLVVLGGFIGSTEDGRTTTLGRGGSDLTASIVGAAVNAEEIQVWKDVDGMLSCDPRLFGAGCQVRRLSYEEASELAKAGAAILHPEMMIPAQRLRIPIVIRNTFCPEREGTRIDSGAAPGANLIKSVAVKQDVTLLEVRSAGRIDGLESFLAFCREHSSAATVLGSSERAVYLALDENAKIPDEHLAMNGCLEARVQGGQAVLTLVGQDLDKELMERKLTTALTGLSAFLIPGHASLCSVAIAVPQRQVQQSLALVHQAFFFRPDPQFFVVGNTSQAQQNTIMSAPSLKRENRPRSFAFSTGLLHTN